MPIPIPRKSVKQMVQEYEDDIIQPPLEFRNDYKPVPLPRTKKTVPLPRTEIKQVQKALKGYTKSFEISIKHKKDPLSQLQNTRKAIEHHIENILSEMKGLKFVETLEVTFTKMTNHDLIHETAYFNCNPKTITDNVNIPKSLQLSKEQILNIIAKWISEGSGWIVESVNGHYLNIVKYEPISASSYIELPTELKNNMKGLINIKDEDNECFIWCHIRHLNPQNKDPQRIKKSDKLYIKKLNYDEN